MNENYEKRICQNCSSEFVIEPDDFGFYEQIKVSAPTFCFECRLQRKMARRNERSLYKRKCDLCHSNIISMYPPGTLFPVYCPKCWWGDGWDSFEYGSKYDFSKSFFEQFNELSQKVPRVALYQKNSVNSPYTNHGDNLKNSYLALNCGFSENVFYSKWLLNSKDVVDSYATFDSELCYELDTCKRCSKCSFLQLSKNCIDSAYLYNCYDCMNCFLSSNLRNKKYYFKNKQLSKDEYEKEISKFLGSFSGHEKAMEILNKEILPITPRKYMISGKEVNSSGDYIFGGSKNLKKCFRVYTSEDSAYLVDSASITNSYDAYESAINCEQQYECHAGNRLAYSKFCSISYDSHDLEYSEMCHDSEYLFACIALRKKKYCILNTQYTKEKYKELMEKIKEHMIKLPFIDKKGNIYKYGEFFPVELSPFYYNETIAQEYFPLLREQAIALGYHWRKKEKRKYEIEIKAEDLPDSTKDMDEKIIGKVIGCAHHEKNDHKNCNCDDSCTEAFKIVMDEFSFYKRMNLLLPRLCPNCRHYARQKERNPMKLWHRTCMCDKENHNHKEKCKVEFETSYAPDRPEIIYCESCYKQEVY